MVSSDRVFLEIGRENLSAQLKANVRQTHVSLIIVLLYMTDNVNRFELALVNMRSPIFEQRRLLGIIEESRALKCGKKLPTFKDECKVASQLNRPLQVMFGHGQPEIYVAGGTNSSLSDTSPMCTDLLIKCLQSQLVSDHVISILHWRIEIDTWTNSGHLQRQIPKD